MTLQTNAGPVEQIVLPSTRDLGGFSVRRALPSAKRRMVGPFVFLDSFGPVVFRAGQGVDTRPHPHIGLSTITYLIEGEIEHRDSERYVHTIRPGEVNLMTAGRGIVHSERSTAPSRARDERCSASRPGSACRSIKRKPIPAFNRSWQTKRPSSPTTA